MTGAWSPTVLRDYALIADGERGVLVGPHGEMVWLCFPRWDSPAVFASLIGGGGGYQVVPKGDYVWGGSYAPASLIWRSRWVTAAGVVECREALSLPGRSDQMTVLRRVTTEKPGAVSVTLALRSEFGRRGSEACGETTPAAGGASSTTFDSAGPAHPTRRSSTTAVTTISRWSSGSSRASPTISS